MSETCACAYRVVKPDHARRLHWSWECHRCEWTGWDLYSEGSATREAERHQRQEHAPAEVMP